MASAPSNKILRVGIIQGGKIIEERHLKNRVDVTIGHDAKNTIVVPASNLPGTFPVFEHKANQYALCFTEEMEGRVRVGDTDVDFASLKAQGLAKKRGQVYVYPLSEVAKGKISLGEITLLFQFVVPPPEPPKTELPPLVKGSFLAAVDRLFLGVLAASLFIHFSGATCIILRPMPVERELSLDELPDRFAKVLVPPKVEEVKPVEVAEAATDEKKEASKDEKKETAEKKEAKPAGPASKAELQKKVANKGLLGVLGSKGSGGGAFEDVLGSGTGSADIADALAGAGGVGVATADAIGAGGQKGGGSGQAATIGDLGTSGGGSVDIGSKGDAQIRGRVKDETPDVDSSDVDPAAVARYVKSRIRAIQSCYEKELKRNPSMKGKVVVRFTINPNGRVGGVEIEENTLGNEAVSSCIRTTIRTWVFPFKPDDEVPVAYPFVFAPASSG